MIKLKNVDYLFCIIKADQTFISVNAAFKKHFPSIFLPPTTIEKIEFWAQISSFNTNSVQKHYFIDLESELTKHHIRFRVNLIVNKKDSSVSMYLKSVIDNTNKSFLMKNLLQKSDDLIFVKNSNFDFIYVNQAFSDFVELPVKSIIGKKVLDILPEKAAIDCMNSDYEALVIENVSLLRDSVIKDAYVEMNKTAFSWSNEKIVGGIIRSQSKLKDLEKKLVERELFITSLLDNLKEGILVLDDNFHIIGQNTKKIWPLFNKPVAKAQSIFEIEPFNRIENLHQQLDHCLQKKIHLAIKHHFEYHDKTHVLTLKINPLSNKNQTYLIILFEIDNEEAVLSDQLQTEVVKNIQLSKELNDFQENRLLTIASELHDNVCQILTAALFQVEMISKADTVHTPEIINSIKNALIALKFIIRKSNIDKLKNLPLKEAITSLIEDFLALKIVTIDFTYQSNKQFNNFEQVNILRILQEIFTLTTRHTVAKHIRLSVKDDGAITSFCISDNGIDLQLDKSDDKNENVAIKNIINRIQLIGAKVSIESDKDSTKFNIKIKNT